VDNAADADPLSVLQQKAAGQAWDEVSALYLASDESSMVTGQAINVDGGSSIRSNRSRTHATRVANGAW
jgi:enoyl-[acyl-carrier-protein] reductase (NADH)